MKKGIGTQVFAFPNGQLMRDAILVMNVVTIKI